MKTAELLEDEYVHPLALEIAQNALEKGRPVFIEVRMSDRRGGATIVRREITKITSQQQRDGRISYRITTNKDGAGHQFDHLVSTDQAEELELKKDGSDLVIYSPEPAED